MPLNRQQDVLDAEKAASDLLSSQPAASDASILDTSKKVGVSRDTSNDTIAAVARETAGKYGLPANVEQGAAPGIAYGNEDLARTNEDALALRKMRERQDNVNRTFNNVFSQMLSATGNRQLAAQTAMQFALDQDRRAFTAAQGEKSRSQQTTISNMQDQFAQKRVALQRQAAQDARKNALVNSMLRTFFGISGQIGTAYALKGAGGAGLVAKTVAPATVAGVSGSGVPSEYDDNFGMTASSSRRPAGTGL